MLSKARKQPRLLSGIIIILVFMLSFGVAWASEITPDKVISLVNESRLSNKESVVVKNEGLMTVAQMKIDDMFAKGYFAHDAPDGTTPWAWFNKAKYDYTYAGENLAIHFTDAESQQKAWMESTTHRKNILNPDYHEIGVAVRSGMIEGKNTLITVQEFGSRQGVVYPTLSAPSEKTVAEEVSQKVMTPISLEKASWETVLINRAYEQVLILFWSVMMAQVVIVSFIVFRVPKKTSKKMFSQEEYSAKNIKKHVISH